MMHYYGETQINSEAEETNSPNVTNDKSWWVLLELDALRKRFKTEKRSLVKNYTQKSVNEKKNDNNVQEDNNLLMRAQELVFSYEQNIETLRSIAGRLQCDAEILSLIHNFTMKFYEVIGKTDPVWTEFDVLEKYVLNSWHKLTGKDLSQIPDGSPEPHRTILLTLTRIMNVLKNRKTNDQSIIHEQCTTLLEEKDRQLNAFVKVIKLQQDQKQKIKQRYEDHITKLKSKLFESACLKPNTSEAAPSFSNDSHCNVEDISGLINKHTNKMHSSIHERMITVKEKYTAVAIKQSELLSPLRDLNVEDVNHHQPLVRSSSWDMECDSPCARSNDMGKQWDNLDSESPILEHSRNLKSTQCSPVSGSSTQESERSQKTTKSPICTSSESTPTYTFAGSAAALRKSRQLENESRSQIGRVHSNLQFTRSSTPRRSNSLLTRPNPSLVNSTLDTGQTRTPNPLDSSALYAPIMTGSPMSSPRRTPRQ